MFQVISRSCRAPKSGGGKYRHPVHILVVKGETKHAYRAGDADVIREWSNVDSRYDGPRSAHGQALAAARNLATSLNEKEEASTVLGFDSRCQGGQNSS